MATGNFTKQSDGQFGDIEYEYCWNVLSVLTSNWWCHSSGK